MAGGRKQISMQKGLQLLGLEYPKPYRCVREPERRPLLGGSMKYTEHLHVKTTGHYKVVANTKRQKIVSWLDRINHPEKANRHLQNHIPGNPGMLCAVHIYNPVLYT